MRLRMAESRLSFTSVARISAACGCRAASTSRLAPGSRAAIPGPSPFRSSMCGSAAAAISATNRDPSSICGKPLHPPQTDACRGPARQLVSYSADAPAPPLRRHTPRRHRSTQPKSGCPSLLRKCRRRVQRQSACFSALRTSARDDTRRRTAFTMPCRVCVLRLARAHFHTLTQRSVRWNAIQDAAVETRPAAVRQQGNRLRQLLHPAAADIGLIQRIEAQSASAARPSQARSPGCLSASGRNPASSYHASEFVSYAPGLHVPA